MKKTIRERLEDFDPRILQHTVGDLDVTGDPVVVYGISGAGKSTFDAMIGTADALRDSRWQLYPEEAANQHLVEVNEFLKKGERPPPTDPGILSVTAWRAQCEDRRAETYLVFPDAAGEYFGKLKEHFDGDPDSEDTAVARGLTWFIENAAAILVLIDVGDDASTTNQMFGQIKTDLAFARKRLGIETGVRRRVPLAVCLTKMDRYFIQADNKIKLRTRGSDEPSDYISVDQTAFDEILKHGCSTLESALPLANPGRQRSGFSTQELAWFGSYYSARDFLVCRHAENLMKAFTDNYEPVEYFALSSIGIFPVGDHFHPRCFNVHNNGDPTQLRFAPLWDLRPVMLLGPICWVLDWGQWLQRSWIQRIRDRLTGKMSPELPDHDSGDTDDGENP